MRRPSPRSGLYARDRRKIGLLPGATYADHDRVFARADGHPMHPEIASERLGHASAKITWDIDQHVSPTMQSNAAETVARLIVGPAT